MKPRTNVYIDGFNLFYGALKGTPYKWLNLRRLSELLLPTNDVRTVKYFTAQVTSRPGKPNQGIHQQFYLRALKTLPDLEIVFGHFLTSRVRMPLVNPVRGLSHSVEVIKTEEKGSDVNMATHLIHDAHQGVFDVAVLITNDSDLLGPIEIVQQELGLPVGVITPHKRFACVLAKEATFKKRIRTGVLRASQFPETLTDALGAFRKPSTW